MFFQRMSYPEKKKRLENGTGIFYWDLDEGKKDILTVVLDQYTAQKPFRFDAVLDPFQRLSVSIIEQNA